MELEGLCRDILILLLQPSCYTMTQGEVSMSFEKSLKQHENSSFMDNLIQAGGERQTTFMVYLSGTMKDIGGNTVFPQLGISVKPIRGTALYWNNIKADGKFDTRSSHLGE